MAEIIYLGGNYMLENWIKPQIPEEEELDERLHAARSKLSVLQMQIKEHGLPVLVLFEGWGTAGKGSVLGKVIKNIDPRFFKVATMDEPTEEERRKPFLYRYFVKIPANGKLEFLDSGWMDEVVKDVLHDKIGEKEYKKKIESVKRFERQLTDNGYLVMKFFFQISRKEQKKRIEVLKENKDTRWRVSGGEDWQNKHYDKCMHVFDRYLNDTNSPADPWYIVDAKNRKWAELQVLETLVSGIETALKNSNLAVPLLQNVFPLEKIPQLELKDITREPAKLYIDPKKIGGVDVIHHNMFTNGIAYIMMCYDCKNVPDELLPYIGLLSSVLGLMDTEKYTYTELTNEININCGGISTDAAIYTDNKDFDKCTIMYEVKGKVLYDNIQFVLDMMNEIIYKTKFSDYKRLKEIIAKLKSRMESTMTSAGHSTAMLAGMAQFSRNAYYSNEMRGYGFYELIQKLDSQFDELKEDIADKLSKLVDYIFHKENIIVSFTADDKGYDAFAPAFGKYAEELKKSDMPACERKYTPANVKTGYTSASQVQYVARCGNFRDGGYEYTGALRVLKVIFSYDYLWINVRVKGGAYGCMSGSYRNGDMYMVSYRDPNLRKTNDIYENAADYLEHFDVSDRDMVKFIIGTIGDMDTPMNPAAKGTRSFGAYICNTDYESLKKERGQVLDCNVERIRELAPLVRCAMDENYFCVVGSSKEINKESELFDKIQPLIKVQG